MTLRSVKMSRFPVGRHKGEYWAKLDIISPGDRFRLLKVEYRWAHELTNEQIQRDTFSDMTPREFGDLMEAFYKVRDVFGLFLTFKRVDGFQDTFTTFRAYDTEKDRYYQRCCAEGDLFQVVRT